MKYATKNEQATIPESESLYSSLLDLQQPSLILNSTATTSKPFSFRQQE